jgi:hypothetical protein
MSAESPVKSAREREKNGNRTLIEKVVMVTIARRATIEDLGLSDPVVVVSTGDPAAAVVADRDASRLPRVK